MALSIIGSLALLAAFFDAVQKHSLLSAILYGFFNACLVLVGIFLVAITWYLSLWMIKSLIIWITNKLTPSVYLGEGQPLKAWKIARPTPSTFRPTISPTSYRAEDLAKCPKERAHPPHDGHVCGFYARTNRLPAILDAFFEMDGGYAVLEVELSGRVIEGWRHVYRGEHQRVLSVMFRPLCQLCLSPFPRRAVGVSTDGNKNLIPVCGKHRRYNFRSLGELANSLGTEVTWSAGRLCRLYLRLRPERL